MNWRGETGNEEKIASPEQRMYHMYTFFRPIYSNLFLFQVWNGIRSMSNELEAINDDDECILIGNPGALDETVNEVDESQELIQLAQQAVEAMEQGSNNQPPAALLAATIQGPESSPSQNKMFGRLLLTPDK